MVPIKRFICFILLVAGIEDEGARPAKARKLPLSIHPRGFGPRQEGTAEGQSVFCQVRGPWMSPGITEGRAEFHP